MVQTPNFIVFWGSAIDLHKISVSLLGLSHSHDHLWFIVPDSTTPMLIHVSWPVTLLSFSLCQPGFKLTSLSWFSSDHPKHLCATDLTEIMSNGEGGEEEGKLIAETQTVELSIGHSNSNKPLDLCVPGDFSLATFLCGFQSPIMLLVFRFLSHLPDPVFPTLLSWSKSHWCSLTSRVTYSRTLPLESHRRTGGGFEFPSFLSSSLAFLGWNKQHKDIFLTGRSHPLRRQKKLGTVSLIHITMLTHIFTSDNIKKDK